MYECLDEIHDLRLGHIFFHLGIDQVPQFVPLSLARLMLAEKPAKTEQSSHIVSLCASHELFVQINDMEG